jgi:putative SOS response-associated peptidase YedK
LPVRAARRTIRRMCGRATLKTPLSELRRLLGLQGELPLLVPRFNIAPSQPLPIIRTPHHLELLRWGLPTAARPMINVRAETVARAPQYRDSFRLRRCLVIVDGFYEWQRVGKRKQPFYLRREDGQPFALGGIWDGEGCAVITAPARGVAAELHDRMPVLLPPDAYERWLDPDAKQLFELMAPDGRELCAYAVSTAVNNPANEDPSCIEPQREGAPGENLELF